MKKIIWIVRHLFITPGLLARIFIYFLLSQPHCLPAVCISAKDANCDREVCASGSKLRRSVRLFGEFSQPSLLGSQGGGVPSLCSIKSPPPGSVAALRLIVSADESQVHAPRRGRRVCAVSQIASRFQADVPRSLEPSARSGTQSHFAPHFTSIGAEKRAPWLAESNISL